MLSYCLGETKLRTWDVFFDPSFRFLIWTTSSHTNHNQSKHQYYKYVHYIILIYRFIHTFILVVLHCTSSLHFMNKIMIRPSILIWHNCNITQQYQSILKRIEYQSMWLNISNISYSCHRPHCYINDREWCTVAGA